MPCPYGFDKMTGEGAAKPCPYGFDKMTGEGDAKRSSDVNAVKAPKGGAWRRSKVHDLQTPEEFIAFLTKAMKDRTGPEMREFYVYLQDCFTSADQDLDGMIGPREFDALVEETAGAPRTFGFAPSAEQLFMSEAERLAARAEMFRAIDTSGTGLVSFPQFLRWATEHIQSKIARGAKPWKGGVGMLSLIQPASAEDFTTSTSTSCGASPTRTPP
mmetsp:Transcript_119801/g.350280  ORF Transcript_119801/g.350280 Transcript_119801/m.350280 type:complete len:215 (-) Transcript_119801:16-660(-)